jgi:hypothetical protein
VGRAVGEGAVPPQAGAELSPAIGLFWRPLGAAAIGVILCFIGAIGSHLRVRDPATNAAIPLVLAIAALTLRLATT